MLFEDLCEFFEKVKHKRGLNEKQKIVKDQFQIFRNLGSSKSHEESIDQMFSIMRLIVPKLDRDRSTYNMKEARISRILIKMLSLPTGNDKNMLTKSYQHSGVGEEFSEIVFTILRKYISTRKSHLTVQELNKCLDDITQRESDAEADEILLKLFRKCTPEHSKWIIKIILREMKFGIDADKILKCYHPDGLSLYSTNNNLCKVCEILFDPTTKLNEIEINIFEPFRPMLSKRVDNKVFKKEFVDDKEYIIDNKWDGERFQLHMENNKFRYFSRNAFDFTKSFGDSFQTGDFTPKLKGVIHEDIHRIILDGEMMLYNKYRKEYGSKGMSLDVKKLWSNGAYQPCFVIYDILMINDTVITSKPLKDRLTILKEAIVKEISGVITISDSKIVNSRADIVNALNTSLDNEEEGIIIKNTDSEYKCGQRVMGWYKLKLEYFNDVMNDLDLLLMGGVYVTSDTERLNTFFLGVKSGDSYVSFAKVASGLSYEEQDMIDKKLKNDGFHIDEFEARNNNRYIFGKEKPLYWIEPEKSLIFVVRATELIRAGDKTFKTPYTLRFPRILNIRTDKPADECMDMNELLDLSQQHKAVIKLNKRYLDLNEILAVKPRPAKIKKRIIMGLQDFGEKLNILNNYTINVLNGAPEVAQDIIEDMVTHMGGKVSFKIDEKVDIVLMGKEEEKKLKNLLETTYRKFDIIDASWLFRIKQQGELLGYNSEEVISIGCKYKNTLCDSVDNFGDCNFEETSVETLKHAISVLDKNNSDINTNEFITCVEKLYRMKNYIAYFDKFKEINNKESEVIYNSFLDEIEFQYYKGSVRDSITPEVNLVICSVDERIQIVEDFLKSNNLRNIMIEKPTFIEAV